MWEKVVTVLPIFVAALGSGGVVKLIDFWIERKREKALKKENQYVTQKQLEELKQDIKKQNDELRAVFTEKTDALVNAQKVSMRARINDLGTGYIKQGWISSPDLEIIIEMHDAYHKLGGNGHLNSVMDQVKQLPIH